MSVRFWSLVFWNGSSCSSSFRIWNQNTMNKRKSKSRREMAVESGHQDQLGLERLIFFSDAVFAIAITLLVLEIRLPAGTELLDDSQLFTQLTGMWHEYLAYFISFIVIGTFW